MRWWIPAAIGIVIVGFSEGVAAAKEYATKHKYEIDANQELIGLGAANIGSGLLSGFVVDGSLSKSAAADNAGGGPSEKGRQVPGRHSSGGPEVCQYACA